MHPTHHVHISTDFMFVCLLFVVAVIAIFAWLSWSKRQDSIRKALITQEHEERMARIQREHDAQITRRVMDNTTQTRPVACGPSRASVPAARPIASSGYGSMNAGPSPSAPVVVNTGASRGSDNSFMEGALLGGIAGSMIGGRDHDTVIEREVSAPSPAPDPFAGSGSDAGSSGGGFDYSSGGSDSGGGFDCSSSGGSDGGGCDF
ncbi:hypothetical protein B0W47_07875 [Komagataeibacter nataicola]|uniref:Uncharacterized protein n=1 Tax=Komagataeibacter nataicola TaxID=265960 RepID=A0A9N7H149_9PROT|nr:hypothetical protein [Komagataeibacter nataicola]AQU87407.1 hypothetical protein B0W47_07875 [Komagataeibacter nataicola]PYD65258.1 hypothetical protein CDI09_14445 [Komagataeibacter nataicola]WNM09427.1 hypothetical protein RI056_05590 [Komagataeibacter nataicola]GBR18566.1 hypothetical protein AA0616_1325 [Komagataeibacter nataicola NRIC 0616]